MPTEDAAVDLSFGLEGKVAVITGGAAGIGAAIARAFVSKGAQVIIRDLDFEAAHAQAGKLGQNAAAVACNVADPSSANDAVRAVLTESGRVDILVNCAGVVFLAPAEDLTPEQWDITLGVNLKGTFLIASTSAGPWPGSLTGQRSRPSSSGHGQPVSSRTTWER